MVKTLVIVSGGGLLVPDDGLIGCSSLCGMLISSEKEFSLKKDVLLLCRGRAPLTELCNRRFVFPGDLSHPDVEIRSAFSMERTVVVEQDHSV